VSFATHQRGGEKVKRGYNSRQRRRAVPWIVAVAAVIAFGATFSELQRVRGRFAEVTRHEFHDHQDVRQFIIRAAMDGLDRPIVVIGDSIVEMAKLPDTIDGRAVVNAGIGGATISDFETVADRLMDGFRPSIIAVALGTNNEGSGTIKQDYLALLARVKKLAPRVIAIGIPSRDDAERTNAEIRSAAEIAGVAFVAMPGALGSFLPDKKHLSAVGYAPWIRSLIAAIRSPTS
jgi:hypothetical protein